MRLNLDGEFYMDTTNDNINIIKNLDPTDLIIFDGDDPKLFEYIVKCPARKIKFSSITTRAEACLQNDSIYFYNHETVRVSDITLRGVHNYKNIMEDIDLTREENLEKKKAHVDEIKKMVEANGGDPSKSVPERRIESLQDIMSELSDITGEKYELSIDVEDEGNDQPDEKTTKLFDELPEDLTSLTVKELKTFCKKHDIELPNNARKAVIIEKINYILHGTN